MQVTVCIGSSCHIKGSKHIVEQLQALIAENALEGKVQLLGAFCMGNCMNGVSVKVAGELYSLQPENVKKFFEDEILSRL